MPHYGGSRIFSLAYGQIKLKNLNIPPISLLYLNKENLKLERVADIGNELYNVASKAAN
jgi:hypothetical protein